MTHSSPAQGGRSTAATSILKDVNDIYYSPMQAVGKYQSIIPALGSHHPSQHISIYRGPSDESNWVIPGLLLASASPAHSHDPELRTLRSILRLGIKTFVCLQQEYRHTGVTEMEWRTGQKPRPYFQEAQRIHAQQLHAMHRHHHQLALYNPHVHHPTPPQSSSLNFVHFPIVDVSVHPDDKLVLQQCYNLCERLLTKEPMVVHCHGGHGRTGIVVSIMLGILYNLDAETAMSWVQATHDTRVYTLNCPSPQTMEQRDQVTRALNLHFSLLEQQKNIVQDPIPYNSDTPVKNNLSINTVTLTTPTTKITGKKDEEENNTHPVDNNNNNDTMITDTPISTPNPSVIDTPKDLLRDPVVSSTITDGKKHISTPSSVIDMDINVGTPTSEVTNTSTVNSNDTVVRSIPSARLRNTNNNNKHRRYPYSKIRNDAYSSSSSSLLPLTMNHGSNGKNSMVPFKGTNNNSGNILPNQFVYSNIDTENKEEIHLSSMKSSSSSSSVNLFHALLFQQAQQYSSNMDNTTVKTPSSATTYTATTVPTEC